MRRFQKRALIKTNKLIKKTYLLRKHKRIILTKLLGATISMHFKWVFLPSPHINPYKDRYEYDLLTPDPFNSTSCHPCHLKQLTYLLSLHRK